MDKNRLDLNFRMNDILRNPTIPLFLPRETISISLFHGARIESNTPASKNVYFIQPVVQITSHAILVNLILCVKRKCTTIYCGYTRIQNELRPRQLSRLP